MEERMDLILIILVLLLLFEGGFGYSRWGYGGGVGIGGSRAPVHKPIRFATPAISEPQLPSGTLGTL
jgi:hypothetical protein